MSAAAEADQDFILTRTFDAPRDLVFDAWTKAEHLKRWFGPKGVTIPECSLDLRPGGVFHYCMQMPDGSRMWGKWIFREITRPEWLVCVVSFSDEAGGETRHPFAADWPMHTLSTVTFAEQGGKTVVTVAWRPLDATEAERRAFAAGRSGMQQGWGGTMDQLTAYLATLVQQERTMLINPYLTSFKGNCREAFEFYAKVLGGKIAMMMTLGESPMAQGAPPEAHGTIIHARLMVGDMVLMGSDAMGEAPEEPKGFSVSLVMHDPAEAERIFAAFAEGGTVRMALAETFWATRFGMVTDRFGTPWMVNCEKAA